MGFNIDAFPGTLTYAKLSQLLTDAGYTLSAFEQNAPGGLVTGTSTRRLPLVSAARRLGVGLATKLFDYQFSATTQNTAVWKCLFSTMTLTQGSGTLLMNANSTATTTTGCQLSTWRYLNFPGNGTVQVEVETQFTSSILANQVFLAGVFPSVSATATPTDGVYFKYTSAGLVGIVNFNGVEVSTATLVAAGAIVSNQSYTLRMDISNSGVDFFLDDTLLATLAPAAANGEPMNWGALPITIQQYNVGAVTGTQMQAKIANVVATQRDIATEKLWENQQALSGLSAAQGSEGQTVGSTALLTNSLAAGAGAAMTNTAASLGTGLGGQFSAQPTLAIGTDGILCSFQNPAGSVNIIPRTLVIKGVSLAGNVTTVLVGGPLIYFYSLAFGHTAVSLATTESGSFATGTAKAPRRIPLGIENYAAAAAVAVQGQGINISFQTPVVVNPGEFVAIAAKNVGSVTTSGVVTWLVRFDAFWE